MLAVIIVGCTLLYTTIAFGVALACSRVLISDKNIDPRSDAKFFTGIGAVWPVSIPIGLVIGVIAVGCLLLDMMITLRFWGNIAKFGPRYLDFLIGHRPEDSKDQVK